MEKYQTTNLPIIQKLIQAYKLWQEYLPHFPKTARLSLGLKIDNLFLEVAKLTFFASFLSKNEKLPLIQKAIKKYDLLKFFLLVAWEIKALDHKKYIALSNKLFEIGKMLGGWQKNIQKRILS